MKKYRYEIILFITEAVCMTLELVASRVLSPFFGNSNIVWTSVIGIILFSSSVGNYLGGKVADKQDSKNLLQMIYLIAGAFVCMIPLVKESILNTLSIIGSIKVGAVLATVFLFLPSSITLGMVIPIVLKIKLEDINTAGNVSGKIYSISTIGGIFGTFLGGFVLVPNMGVISLTFLLSAILFLLSIVSNSFEEKFNFSIVLAIFALFLILLYMIYNQNIEKKILSNKIGITYSLDTQYGNAIMTNCRFDGELVRLLLIDGGFESGTFLEKDKRNELVFDYLKKYDLMFKADDQIENIAMIGGAGYCYPKYVISHYPNVNLDVIEIDEKITEIAKKYYYLDDVLEEYNKNSKRLKLINEDGRIYFNKNEKKYDAILNDAFSGTTPARSLTTIENIENIKKSLKEGGLYLNNIIGTIEGDNSRFIKAEVNTMNKVFNNVYVIPVDTEEKYIIQNFMVVATDKEIDLKDEVLLDLNISNDEIVFTDDYCPTEYLEINR